MENIEAFRQHAHDIVDWIADFYKTIETYSVKSHVHPGEIKGKLPSIPPDRSESFESSS